MINNEKFKAVGIIGNPLKQSLSPYLHNYWINKYNLSSYYLPLPISNISNIAVALKKMNFLGLNVTIPHKLLALKIADESSSIAQYIGAANTLTFTKENKIYADYTDAYGFINY